jgi:sorting nexin-1/2
VVFFLSFPIIYFLADLAIATGEFGQTIADLASSDLGKQLSHSLSGLADVETKAQEFQQVQNEQDMVTIMSTGW